MSNKEHQLEGEETNCTIVQKAVKTLGQSFSILFTQKRPIKTKRVEETEKEQDIL